MKKNLWVKAICLLIVLSFALPMFAVANESAQEGAAASAVVGDIGAVLLISYDVIEIEFNTPILSDAEAQATFTITIDGQAVEWEFLSYFAFGPYALRGGVVNVRLAEQLDTGECRGLRRGSTADAWLVRTDNTKGPAQAARLKVAAAGVEKTATWQAFYRERSLGFMSRILTYVSAAGGTNNATTTASSFAANTWPLYSDEFIARQVGEGVHRFFGRAEFLALPMVRSGFRPLIVGPSQSVYEAPEYRDLYKHGVTTDTYTRPSIKATDVPGNFDPVTGFFSRPYIVGTSDDIMKHNAPIRADGSAIPTSQALTTTESARPRSDFFYFGEAFADYFYEVGVVVGSRQYPLSTNNNWDDHRYDLHVERAYEEAKALGKWPNTAMMENVKNYYIYGFMVFQEFIPESLAFEYKSFPVNTRAEVYEYDYNLYWAMCGIHGKYDYWTGVGTSQGASTIDDSSKYTTPWFWGNQPDNIGMPAEVDGTEGVPYEPLYIKRAVVNTSTGVTCYFNREVRTRQFAVNAANYAIFIDGARVATVTETQGYNWTSIRLNSGTRLDNGRPYGRSFRGFKQSDLDERSVANGGWIANNQALDVNALEFGQFMSLEEAIERGAGLVGLVEVMYIGGAGREVRDWDGNECSKTHRTVATFQPWIGHAYRTPLTGLYVYLDSEIGNNKNPQVAHYDPETVAIVTGTVYEAILQNNETITYPRSAGDYNGTYLAAFPSGSGSNHDNLPRTYDRTGQRIADGAVRGNGGCIIGAGSVLGRHPGVQAGSGQLRGTSVGDSYRIEGWGGTTFQSEDVLAMRDYNLCRYKNEALILHEGGHGVDSFQPTYANYGYRDITSAHAVATSQADGRRWYTVDNVGAYAALRGEYVSTGTTFFTGTMRESFQGNNDGTWTPICVREGFFRYDPYGFESHKRNFFSGELGLWYENRVGDPDYRVLVSDWELLRDQNEEFEHWWNENYLVAWGSSIIETARHNPYTEMLNNAPFGSQLNDNIRWVSWNVPNVWNPEPYKPPSNPSFQNNRFDFAGSDFCATGDVGQKGGTPYHPLPPLGVIPVEDLTPLEQQTHPFFKAGGTKRPVRDAESLALLKPVNGTVVEGSAKRLYRPVQISFEFTDFDNEITRDNAQTTFLLKINGQYTHFYFWDYKVVEDVATVTIRLDYPISVDAELEVEMRPVAVELTPTAVVTKLNGNKNELTITLVEEFAYGQINTYVETFMIDNNSAGTYDIGGYYVYVDTKGNTDIRDIHVVGSAPKAPVGAPKTLVNAATSAKDILLSTGTSVTFNVTETYSDGTTKVVTYTIQMAKNSSGRFDLGEYILVYDIAGNGSNVKTFNIVMK